MSEIAITYRDAEGNSCSLDELCCREPAWAADHIRNLLALLEARTFETSVRIEACGLYQIILDLREHPTPNGPQRGRVQIQKVSGP